MASTTPATDPSYILERLRKAVSLQDAAEFLGYTPTALAYILYKIPASARYTPFEVAKKSGGVRKIYAPRPELKALQRRLADRLSACQLALEAETGHRNTASHAFRSGTSHCTNASEHRKQRFVLNLDLKDFFTAINFGRVRGYFIKSKDFGLAPKVATILSQIACHEPDSTGVQFGRGSFLPQGSPCSPVISNLIAGFLDKRLAGLAKQNGCRYTRYADDITFSTGKKSFPKPIAELTVDTGCWDIGAGVIDAIKVAGFEVNDTKTRMQLCDSRQEVTGLVVNSITNTRSEYRATARAMVRSLTKDGHYVVSSTAEPSKDMNRLAGMLGYISHIDRIRTGQSLSASKWKELPSRERVYQRFLYYRHFYSSELPVIVCEGKTDSIYLKFAFRALAEKFPQLYSVDDKGAVQKHVRIFTHPENHAGALIGLSAGGVGDLSVFLRNYIRETAFFSAPSSAPLLVLADCDSGFKKKGGLLNTVRDLTKGAKVDSEQGIFPLGRSVYVLTTPLLGKEETMIEDFFGPDALDQVIDGKKFHADGEGFDKNKHFSKQVFAVQVIQAKHEDLAFTGFEPLLQRIAEVLDLHAAKLANEGG